MTEISIDGYLEGHPVRATWRDGQLDGHSPLVATIEGMVAGAGRVSIPGVVAGVATLDPAEELLVRATLTCACDARPYPRLGGDPAPPSPARFDADVDY
jgi:hypothetical protein